MSFVTRVFYSSRGIFRLSPFTPSYYISRFLFSQTSLRMDVFSQSRDMFKSRIRNREDQFAERIKKLQSGRNIYEEDLKMVCFTADKEQITQLKDLLTIYFSDPNPRLGGDFRLGPVVMRLCHFHNEPDIALEIFQDRRLQPIFNYQAAILVFLDLLIKNKLYEEVISSFEEMMDMEWIRSIKSRAVPVPYILSLFAKGDLASLEKAMKFYDAITTKELVLRRMPLAIAGLALKCNQLNTALRLASRYPSYYTSYNILIQAYVQMHSWKQAVSILSRHQDLTLLKDTTEILLAHLKPDQPERKQVLELMAKSSKKNQTVEDLLLSEIEFTAQDVTTLQRKRDDHSSLLELRNAFKKRVNM